MRDRSIIRDRNINELQGLNLGVDWLMRGVTMFRAVQNTIVTFSLASSSTNTL